MTKLLTEIADYDEPGSWGRMSNGWPDVGMARAYDMYVFANCAPSIPYGSYVLMDVLLLRVHPDYIDQLRADFEAAGRPSKDESVRRRGGARKAEKWWP